MCVCVRLSARGTIRAPPKRLRCNMGCGDIGFGGLGAARFGAFAHETILDALGAICHQEVISHRARVVSIERIPVEELPDEAGHSAEGAKPAGATAGSQTYLAHKLGRATSKCNLMCGWSKYASMQRNQAASFQQRIKTLFLLQLQWHAVPVRVILAPEAGGGTSW